MPTFKKRHKKQYNEPRSRDSFTRSNESSKIELRRDSHSSETEQSDEAENEEYKMPLCWADDEPLDQTGTFFDFLEGL